MPTTSGAHVANNRGGPAATVPLLDVCRAAIRGVEWRALVPLLVWVGCFHLVVAAILLVSGLPLCYWPYGETTLLATLLVTCVMVGAAAILVPQIARDMWRQSHGLMPAPLHHRIAHLARLVVCGWALAVVYAAVLIAYVNLKPAIPLLNPATYDAAMESTERALFGGVFPTEWLVTRSSPATLAAWDVIYGLFALVLFVSMMIALNYDGLRGGARLVLALAIGLFLDMLTTLAFPTRGPLFVHPEWFAALKDLPSGELSAFLSTTIERYAAKPGTVYACAGISAMPSYHVYGWTCALLCWRHLPRPLVIGVWGLALLNWISTVVLGWHYVLDGAVGIVLALLVWRMTARLSKPRSTAAN